MYTIQANASGTRTIEVTESNLQTIKFLKMESNLSPTVRSLIASCEEDSKALLELCLVLYDDNMKPLGLGNLIECYNKWEEEQAAPATENTENE